MTTEILRNTLLFKNNTSENNNSLLQFDMDINNDLGGDYELINDIDCSEIGNRSSGEGFEPIGAPNLPFTGSFNGNG